MDSRGQGLGGAPSQLESMEPLSGKTSPQTARREKGPPGHPSGETDPWRAGGGHGDAAD